MAPAASGAWRRFLSAHYAVNAAVLASYLLVRLLFKERPDAPPGRIKTAAELHAWEKQTAVALVAVILFRLWRRRSWDHAAAQILFWAKVVLAMMVFLVDPRLLAWYCIVFYAIYVLLPQPIADLATDAVSALTPTTLKEAIVNSDSASLVLFYTQTQGNSVAAAPAFLEVAEEFASPKLRFGSFDVGVWPRAAAEARLSSNTWSNQLPAVVLYEKGKEWGRLPPAEIANDPSKRNYYTKGDIIRLFKLEERFLKPLDASTAATAGKQPASKKAQ